MANCEFNASIGRLSMAVEAMPSIYPVACRPVEDLNEIQRNVFCPFYENCLDIADLEGWENFACIWCRMFKPQTGPLDKWLKANCFTCKLGRITPEQCETNRKRKRLAEKVDMHDHSPEARARLAGVVVPTACESCTDWERLTKGFRHRLQLNETRHTEGGASIMGVKGIKGPSELCICKDCKGNFEAYKRGATVIKSICPACLTKKTSPPKKKKTVAPSEQRPESNGGKALSITLVFEEGDRDLFRTINDTARRERRSPECQVLKWLESIVLE
jgi:hypothetical protein